MPPLREPLFFERVCVPKPWGGRHLERIPGIALDAPGPIGETWEVVDRERENSVVARGEHAGRTLRSLMERYADDLLGLAPPAPNGRFPLLVKYLDCTEALSLQVHPDDAAAARRGDGAEAKTEAWYFLEAREGARVWAGLADGVDARALEYAAREGVVEPVLRAWEVRAGQSLTVPGGTVHGLGAGVVLLEVQQNSDTTYRLYDWGRPADAGRPRALHIDAAVDVASFGALPRPPVDEVWEAAGEGLRRAPLARSSHFGSNRLSVSSRVRLSTGNQYQIYAVVEGRGVLATKGSSAEHALEPGDVALVPAAAGYHTVVPTTDRLELVQLLWKA